MSLKFTILGCGSSTGVPAAGNYWGACDPAEPRNKRSRPSLLVQSESRALVIDTGADFRAQTNIANMQSLDAVLYTHMHSDHTAGIDELRGFHFRQKEKVPVYMNAETHKDLNRRYDYLFEGGTEDIYPPVLDAHILDDHYGQTMSVGDITFIPFAQNHGHVTSVGYRFGDVAYCTDMKMLDDTAIEILQGIDTWIVDAAGYHQDANPVHANLKTIYALNEKIKAQRVILTSLTLGMDYQTLCDELPEGYEPAYDMLEL